MTNAYKRREYDARSRINLVTAMRNRQADRRLPYVRSVVKVWVALGIRGCVYTL